MAEDIEVVRREFIVLIRKRKRIVPRDLPCRWLPWVVSDPRSGQPFTPNGAWDFVAERLEASEQICEITLDNPAGKKGYVMEIDLGVDVPKLYIKLQRGSGVAMGRSFHPSNPRRGEDSSTRPIRRIFL